MRDEHLVRGRGRGRGRGRARARAKARVRARVRVGSSVYTPPDSTSPGACPKTKRMEASTETVGMTHTAMSRPCHTTAKARKSAAAHSETHTWKS